MAVLCLSCRRDINVIHESVYRTGGQQLMIKWGLYAWFSFGYFFFYYRYNFQTVVFKFAKLELVHKTVSSLIPMQHSTSYKTVQDQNLSTGMRVMWRLSNLHTVEHEAQVELPYWTLESSSRKASYACCTSLQKSLSRSCMGCNLSYLNAHCMYIPVSLYFCHYLEPIYNNIMHVCIPCMMVGHGFILIYITLIV